MHIDGSPNMNCGHAGAADNNVHKIETVIAFFAFCLEPDIIEINAIQVTQA
jgi:hypothetical protein